MSVQIRRSNPLRPQTRVGRFGQGLQRAHLLSGGGPGERQAIRFERCHAAGDRLSCVGTLRRCCRRLSSRLLPPSVASCSLQHQPVGHGWHLDRREKIFLVCVPQNNCVCVPHLTNLELCPSLGAAGSLKAPQPWRQTDHWIWARLSASRGGPSTLRASGSYRGTNRTALDHVHGCHVLR
jgi:hypothetical protein